MREDWLGNPVTTDNEATLAGVNDFTHGFLAYEEKALNILSVADADPDCALANAYAAMLYMFMESRDGPVQAARYLERADATLANATEQERQVAEAIRAWVANDIPKAIELCEAAAGNYPRELATVKACQYHQFNLGNSPGMLRVAELAREANDGLAYMHGMTAFAQEQCHLLYDAEKSARRALELEEKEPWAQHALAHIMLTQGRTGEGIEFMERVASTWTDLNSFMYTHNWWHLAVFHISRGDYQAALAIYDDHVWGILKDYSQDQIGAVSLLLRLELVGVDVGNRWEDVAGYLKVRVDDHVQPFLTMQYLYGLARARAPEADELLRSLGDFAPQSPEFQRAAWTEVCLPACVGLAAHARGDHGAAVEALGRAIPRLVEIGGSHAQRDLFDLVFLDSLIQTGRFVTAQGLLEQRRGFDPEGVPTNVALALVYENRGWRGEAARAAERAAAGIA